MTRMDDQYPELFAVLRRVRKRWRTLATLRAWTGAAMAAVFILGMAVAVNALLAPDGPTLVALWTAAAAGTAVVAGWQLVRLRRSPGEHQLARLVEECCPELEDTLATAVVERERGHAGPM